jgi:hypothetical protein
VSSARDLRQAPSAKLCFLAETVLAEAELLTITDGRLFATPMDATRAASLRQDIELAERVDAFVARFGRLQDTLGDKLLPALLAWLAEPLGPAIDNLGRAERLGWMVSASDWLECRRLRNFMIHEYMRDMQILASALTAAHAAVPMLVGAAQTMAAQVLDGGR